MLSGLFYFVPTHPRQTQQRDKSASPPDVPLTVSVRNYLLRAVRATLKLKRSLEGGRSSFVLFNRDSIFDTRKLPIIYRGHRHAPHFGGRYIFDDKSFRPRCSVTKNLISFSPAYSTPHLKFVRTSSYSI
jgi:hypothetical protein